MEILIKRAYDEADPADGTRILVDRLWPRGVSKKFAQVDHWLKEIAPSAALRKWFGHDPAKWERFRTRYFRELDAKPGVVAELTAFVRAGRVTLVYGARDRDHNDAVALREYVEAAGKARRSR